LLSIIAAVLPFALTTALGTASPALADGAGPNVTGQFDLPISANHDFDAAAPTNVEESTRYPTAVSVVALPNGKVSYWNGLENLETASYPLPLDAARVSQGHNSRARIVSGNAQASSLDFVNPDATTPPDGGATDLFCADLRILLNGSVLVAGGTEWVNDFVDLNDDANDASTPGGTAELFGAHSTRILDQTGHWTQTDSMAKGRWYPTLVTLPDGKLFVASGVGRLLYNAPLAGQEPGTNLDPTAPRATGTNVAETETFNPWVDGAYNPGAGSWSTNASANEITGQNDASATFPLFARMHLISNGKVFYDADGQMWGPFGQGYDEALWNIARAYDPATQKWENVGVGNYGAVNGAASVLLPYDLTTDINGENVASKILHAGGTIGTSPSTYLATNKSEVLTIAQNGDFSAEKTGDLNNKRWYSSSVLGPDGHVYVFSGADTDEVVSPGTEHAVRQEESFDPATGQWTALASSIRDRTYHNSAILLADGRILVGGHSPINTEYGPGQSAAGGSNYLHENGAGTANNYKDPSFEIFTPPYLLDANGNEKPRPQLNTNNGNNSFEWGQPGQVELAANDNSTITAIKLVHMPASTHTTDADAREVSLHFTSNGNGHFTVDVPSNRAVLPPGYYYLFVVGDNGTPNDTSDDTPSVANMVRVGWDTLGTEMAAAAGRFVKTPASAAAAKTVAKPVAKPVAGAAPASKPAPVRPTSSNSPALPVALAVSTMALAVVWRTRRLARA
ncbi:MAG: DUF1929 domain-containing protein, partial [Actinobacteria bacterium]|nr:DUF1929 domain-containing protein [Actinomycetota bacterium]